MTVSQPGRRRLDTSVPPPYEFATREPRFSSQRLGSFLVGATFVLWLIGTAGAATSVVAVGAPEWIWRPAAAVLLVAFGTMLTHRVGGHLRIWASVVTALALSAYLTEINALLVAAAGTTAVLAAVVAVLYTRPADSIPAVLREFVVSLILALSGTFAVAAWNAPVDVESFLMIVMAAALTVAISIVWSLGAGLHGLTAKHLAILAGVAVVTVLLFFYGGFVRSHGSATITAFLDDTIVWLRQNVGGVPRPFEVLVGFPALVVGTSMRSRYRVGWWVCVFAVVGTVLVTVSLVDPGAYPSYLALSTLYSAVLGLAFGLVVRHFVLATRSRRAARAVELPTRVEPARFAPLR